MKNLKCYTQREIAQWENQLDDIPVQIAIHQRNITGLSLEIKQQESALRCIRSEIAPIDEAIRGLQAQIEILVLQSTLPHQYTECKKQETDLQLLVSELGTINTALSPIERDITQLTRYIEIKDTRDSLAYWNDQSRMLKYKLDPFEAQLSSVSSELNEKKRRIAQLDAEITQLEFQETLDTSLYHHHHHHDHHHHHHHDNHIHWGEIIADGLHAYGDAVRTNDLFTKRSERLQLASEQFTLERECRQLQSSANYYCTQLENAKNKITALHHQLDKYTNDEKETADESRSYLLRGQLNKRQNDKAPFANKKNALSYAISEKEKRISLIKSDIANNESRVNQLTLLAKNISHTTGITDLQNQLLHFQNARIPHATKEKQLLEQHKIKTIAVSETQDTVYQLETRANLLRHKDPFLANLHDNPKELATKLTRSMLDTFQRFEKKQPIGQSKAVRMCLADVAHKIQFINTTQETETIEEKEGSYTNSTKEISRHIYYRLCGFLQDLLAHLNHQNDDNLLANEILLLWQQHPIDQHESLHEYRTFQQRHSDVLPILTEEALDRWENQQFENTRKEFIHTLSKLSTIPTLDNVKKKGQSILAAVDDTETTYDIKFRTTLLQHTVNLLNDPQNRLLRNDYKALANHNALGQPVMGKKIAGALLAFLGALLIAACVTAKITTLGIVTPFSTGGIIAGAALCLTGIGLFKSGMRKGVSKKMMALHSVAEKTDKTKPFISADTTSEMYDKPAVVLLAPSAPPL